MTPDNSLTDRKAQAGTPVLTGPGGIGPVIALKYQQPLLRRYARTIVFHGDLYSWHILSDLPGFCREQYRFSGIPNGVGEQVADKA
jgi:hypothetical protein